MSAHKFVHLKSSEVHQMIEDPIVAEVRKHRKEHAAEHGNDLKRIVKALRKRERESKRKLLNPGPKMKPIQNLKSKLQTQDPLNFKKP